LADQAAAISIARTIPPAQTRPNNRGNEPVAMLVTFDDPHSLVFTQKTMVWGQNAVALLSPLRRAWLECCEATQNQDQSSGNL